MKFYLIVFLLFFLPFLVYPVGLSYFETIKVFVAEFVILFIFLILIFKKEIKIKKLFTWRNLVILLLFILSLVNLVLFNKPITFFGNVFRLQGTFLLWHLLLFATLLPFIKIEQKKLIKFSLLSFVITVISVFMFGFDETGRIIGALGEPNAFASFVIFLWPFAIFNFRQNWKRIGVFVAVFILIVLSGSRSGMVAFLLQTVFLLLNFKTNLRIKYINLITVFLILISLVLPYLDKQTVFQNRTEVWKTGIEAGLTHPIIGSGFGNIEVVIQEAANKLQNNIRYQYVDSGHNIIIDYFIQGGLIGAVLLLGLFFITIRRFTNQKNILYIVVFFGLFTTLLFNPASVVGLIGFWFLIGSVEDL